MRFLRPTLASLGLATLAWLACASGSAPAAPGGPTGGDTLRVLFLGNSLTYTNNLPGMLREIAAADRRVVVTRDRSQPNYSLEDHWTDPDSWAAVREGPWDVVVMQQGPSSLPSSRDHLVQWARAWENALATEGTNLALYTVWPDETRLSYLDDVIASYRIAADSAHALLLPAGRAWQVAWQLDPSLDLYGPDRFHPSRLGSALAALTIYRGLTGRQPVVTSTLGASPAESAVLLEAVRRSAGD